MKCATCPLWCGNLYILYCGVTRERIDENSHCTRTQEEIDKLFLDHQQEIDKLFLDHQQEE